MDYTLGMLQVQKCIILHRRSVMDKHSEHLPNVPADCIVYQDNSQDAVYAGTDFGVYYRDATMSDWIPFMTNLPNVMVDDLEIQLWNN